jgi:hypothetical protein
MGTRMKNSMKGGFREEMFESIQAQEIGSMHQTSLTYSSDSFKIHFMIGGVTKNSPPIKKVKDLDSSVLWERKIPPDGSMI